MSPDTPGDFARLTPDAVLDAVETLGLRTDGRLLALNSYENRVYQVGIEDGAPLIAKFYRPLRWSDAAILEEHAFVQELAEHEIPAVAALAYNGHTLHHTETFRFALFPRIGGRAPELENRDTLEWLGRFLGRIHARGRRIPYRQRPALDRDSFGTQPRADLLARDLLPPDLDAAYRSVSAQALDCIAACFDRAGPFDTLRLHGDCHAGNVLWTADGPVFLDFDDSRSGPAIQDLWMLLSGERAERVRQLGDVLAGYETFCDFDARELHLVEALRTLRLIHYADWLAQRHDDPAFKLAFPWFGSQHYWQNHILELREQIAAMEEPPLWPA